jgi:hypothetical protein
MDFRDATVSSSLHHGEEHGTADDGVHEKFVVNI